MPQSIIDQLASSHGRNDEAVNIMLAENIAKKKDATAVEELIGLTQHTKAPIRSDVIKVLYEIAEREPALLKPHFKAILTLLSHKDNRMKWGAMTTLSALSSFDAGLFTKHITAIVDAMDHGSVITRDHGIVILANVARRPSQSDNCLALLFEQLEKAPVNQFPMYAEKTAEVITPSHLQTLIEIIESRQDVMDVPSKKKRLQQLLKKLTPNG